MIWATRLVAVGVLALAGLFGHFLHGAFHSAVVLNEQSLRVAVPMYGRVVAYDALDFRHARGVYLDHESKLRLE